MEGYEEDYGMDVPADQEETELETEEDRPEETGPEETETEQEESDQEETETGTPEPEETPAEEQPENGADEEDSTEEEFSEETEKPDPETVSGNGIVISGDAIIFPEEYDLSALGGEPADTESIVQAVEKQGENMTAGFACTCFMLGVLAGAVIIAGFRLRRV